MKAPLSRLSILRGGQRLALSIALLLVAQFAAAAPQVLFLSTNESGSGLSLANDAYNAFANNSTVISLEGLIDGRGKLGNAQTSDGLTDLSSSDFDDVTMVVITTVYARIDPDAIPVLREAILNRPDLLFIIFADGCCEARTPPAVNVTPLIDILNEGTGWGLTTTHTPSGIVSRLNTASPYAASFATLDPFRGTFYRLINNVPADNVVYLPSGVTAIPADPTSSAYSLILPRRQLNAGAGACLFLTPDASPFGTSGQGPRIADAFMDAAFAADGACQLPIAGVPDLVPQLSGPAILSVGSPADYTLAVTNEGVAASTDGVVTVTLPPAMQVVAASLPAECTPAADLASFSCALSGLSAADPQASPAVAGGSLSIAFQATAQAVMPTAADIEVVITSVTDEIDTADNSTLIAVTAVMTASSQGAEAYPVPVLGNLLALLAMLLPAVASMQLRSKA